MRAKKMGLWIKGSNNLVLKYSCFLKEGEHGCVRKVVEGLWKSGYSHAL